MSIGLILLWGVIVLGVMYGLWWLFKTYPILDIAVWTFIGLSVIVFGFLSVSAVVNVKNA